MRRWWQRRWWRKIKNGYTFYPRIKNSEENDDGRWQWRMTINFMQICPAEDDEIFFADISEGKWWYDEEMAL